MPPYRSKTRVRCTRPRRLTSQTIEDDFVGEDHAFVPVSTASQLRRVLLPPGQGVMSAFTYKLIQASTKSR